MPTTSTNGELVVIGIVLVALGLLAGGGPALLGIGVVACVTGVLESRAAWRPGQVA